MYPDNGLLCGLPILLVLDTAAFHKRAYQPGVDQFLTGSVLCRRVQLSSVTLYKQPKQLACYTR